MPRMPKMTLRRVALVSLLALLALLALVAQLDGGDGGRQDQLVPLPPTVTATATPGVTASPTVSPSPSVDDHGHDGDDGVAGNGPATPTPPPDVREAAAACGAAWLNAYTQTPEQWHEALAKRVTSDLAAELAGVDPRDQVPVGRTDDGKVEVTAVGSVWEATVPIVDRPGGARLGVLTVTVRRATNATFRTDQWLISELGWEPQR